MILQVSNVSYPPTCLTAPTLTSALTQDLPLTKLLIAAIMRLLFYLLKFGQKQQQNIVLRIVQFSEKIGPRGPF